MDFRELRTTYLSFMKSRGYSYSEPDTLLTFEFPYTFTPSGAVNYYWKMIHTPGKTENPTSCQRVFRHWDVSEVGDGRHLSFFEMIGTWSFNGFERMKVLKDHFDFVIRELKLDPKRIYATVFCGGRVFAKNVKNEQKDPLLSRLQTEGLEIVSDATAKVVWTKLGIPKKNIFELGEEDCFLMNTTEPFAAYRTELFYDLSPDRKPVTKELFTAHPARFLEFFVSLHEKWIKHGMVSSESLADPNRDKHSFLQEVAPAIIPAAFGIERLATILQGINNIHLIEPYRTLNASLDQFSRNIPSEIKNRITDCVRGLVFLIADGAGEIRRTENKQRVHIYREHMKRLVSLTRKANCDRQEVYRMLFQKAIELHCEYYPFLAGKLECCLEEIEKQKCREVQEHREREKHQKHLCKKMSLTKSPR